MIDDLIAYVFGPDEVLLIPNAANATTVAAVLAERCTGRGRDLLSLDSGRNLPT